MPKNKERSARNGKKDIFTYTHNKSIICESRQEKYQTVFTSIISATTKISNIWIETQWKITVEGRWAILSSYFPAPSFLLNTALFQVLIYNFLRYFPPRIFFVIKENVFQWIIWFFFVVYVPSKRYLFIYFFEKDHSTIVQKNTISWLLKWIHGI